jgi:hypothetical protein
MKRLLAALLVLTVGCAPLQVDRRTERGPVLRTYQKEVRLGQRTVAANLEAQWPRLELRLVSSEACRTELHEEYAEEIITERHDPSAAPAVASGASTTAIGGGLLLGRSLFSDEPDRDAIDREGRYGASSRDVATGWGVALVALGVPALISGIVQMARSGEERETRKVDSVASLRDMPCDPRPAQGLVQVAFKGAELAPRTITDGRLTLSADELGRVGGIAGILMEGTPVALSEEDALLLAGFSACLELQGQPMEAQALAETPPDALMAMRGLAEHCASVPGSPGKQWLQSVDAALTAASEGAPMSPEGAAAPRYQSFEDAVAQLKPALRVSAGSPDVAKLRDPRPLRGQAVQLVGVLSQRQNPDTAVVQVGEVAVLVVLDPNRAWASDFARGSRVELVGVVEGLHPLGNAMVPLVRAVWMRPAL